MQYDDVPIGDKTVLNELLRLSGVRVRPRRRRHGGSAESCQDLPKKDKPKRTERSRRLREAKKKKLLIACQESRAWFLAPIVELAWETACRRNEIVSLLRWEEINLTQG